MVVLCMCRWFFFFKQKTAYEVRISDWSSDLCSSDLSLAGLRRELLKTIPVKDRIVFAPKDPKYTVAVFTDVECGFCRKLHSQIDDYNREGIAVQYLAFPRDRKSVV